MGIIDNIFDVALNRSACLCEGCVLVLYDGKAFCSADIPSHAMVQCPEVMSCSEVRMRRMSNIAKSPRISLLYADCMCASPGGEISSP